MPIAVLLRRRIVKGSGESRPARRDSYREVLEWLKKHPAAEPKKVKKRAKPNRRDVSKLKALLKRLALVRALQFEIQVPISELPQEIQKLPEQLKKSEEKISEQVVEVFENLPDAGKAKVVAEATPAEVEALTLALDEELLLFFL